MYDELGMKENCHLGENKCFFCVFCQRKSFSNFKKCPPKELLDPKKTKNIFFVLLTLVWLL